MPIDKKKTKQPAPTRLWPCTNRKLKEMSKYTGVEMIQIAEWAVAKKYREWNIDGWVEVETKRSERT